MNSKQTKSLFIISFLFLASCGQVLKDRPQNAPAPQLNEQAKAEHKHNEHVRDQLRINSSPQAPQIIDVTKYSVSGTFIPTEKPTLFATVTIDFRSLMDTSIIFLDSNVAEILSVQGEEGNELNYLYTRSSKTLKIQLKDKVMRNQSSQLSISYKVYSNDPEGSGLFMYSPESTKDPIGHNVLYTKTEPNGTMGWMPSNDRPDDRAAFSIEIQTPRDLSLVSNGLLSHDTLNTIGRIMKWETKIALPTYLMAFAISKFQVSKQRLNDLEISVWSREGLKTDFGALLEETKRQMKLFEKLLLPYPFEKYAIVLIPNFGGGMEHASVTFNGEQSSTVADDNWHRELMAHELAHHWFGNLMTVETWDDLWIKEGLATLLATEAFRETEHVSSKEGSMGNLLWFNKGEAVIDPALKGSNKYNSGPYSRAAWIHSQLRSVVGQRTYWNTLRSILRDHYFGSIGTKKFMSYFRPLMSEEQFSRFEKALYAHDIPKIEIKAKADSTLLSYSVSDPDMALPTPIEFGVSSKTELTKIELGGLSEETTLDFDPTPGNSFLVVDPNDLHPSLYAFTTNHHREDKIYGRFVFENFFWHLMPHSVEAWNAWSKDDRYGVRMNGLIYGKGIVQFGTDLVTPERLLNLYQSTPSSALQTHIVSMMCEVAAQSTESEELLRPTIENEIRTTDLAGTIWWAHLPVESCGKYSAEIFREKLIMSLDENLASNIEDRDVRLLMTYPSDDKDLMTRVWKNLQKNGRTLMIRLYAGYALEED